MSLSANMKPNNYTTTTTATTATATKISHHFNDNSGNRNKRKRKRKASINTTHQNQDKLPSTTLLTKRQQPVSDKNKNNATNNAESSNIRVIHRLPPPLTLPIGTKLRVPQNTFLRNVEPYREIFQRALQTSYEGFVIDTNVLDNNQYNNIQNVLHTDPTVSSYFCTDVTQPFGLGTTCSPTYVTRCLLGDVGTTYKYLGLRMFAHFWTSSSNTDNDISTTMETNNSSLLQPIVQLKDQLSDRVLQHHLPQLYKHRQQEIERMITKSNDTQEQLQIYDPNRRNTNKSSSCFDICLVNRMTSLSADMSSSSITTITDACENTARTTIKSSSSSLTKKVHLKVEPLQPNNLTTVSWHADSCLEHYSTIAVYQLLVPALSASTDAKNEDKSDNENEWSIGLRVSHNAEGPKSKHQDGNSGDNLARSSTNNASNQVAKQAINKLIAPASNNSTGIKAQLHRQESGQGEEQVAPPLEVSLPSNSVYYLLDDFNHHHQHTVMVKSNSNKTKYKTVNVGTSSAKNNSDTNNKHLHHTCSGSTRYSLTFRLLRESHNVHDMIDKCHRCVVQQFHKKSIKVYKYEQLLLNELESEWIRQFYIQGYHHYETLWDDWGKYIMQLWDYWNQLETRTYHVIQFAQYAAEGKCFMSKDNNNSSDPTSDVNLDVHSNGLSNDNINKIKSERKLRAKRKKAMISMFDFEKREAKSVVELKFSSNVATSLPTLYEFLASMLEERAKMRELWSKREAEPIFSKMGQQYRPLALPIRFRFVQLSIDDDGTQGCTSSSSTTMKINQQSENIETESYGLSPMPGTPTELCELASKIRAWGRAYLSSNMVDLPSVNQVLFGGHVRTDFEKTNALLPAVPVNEIETSRNINTSSSVSYDWVGWSSYDIGLEMQYPWSEMLLTGKKLIEVRKYELPSSLLGRKVYIIETPKGKDGVSGILGDQLRFQESFFPIWDQNSEESCGKDTTNQGPRIVGWCIFSSVKSYKSQQEFNLDEKYHLVTRTSAYGWHSMIDTNILYGWNVGQFRCIGNQNDIKFDSGIRRYRSLFQLKRALIDRSENDEKGKQQNNLTLKTPTFTKRSSSMKKKKNMPINRNFDSMTAFKKRRF